MPSPFPKLSQFWRAARIGGSIFGSAAATGLAHLVWSQRVAIVAGAVAVIDAAAGKAFPDNKLANWVADVRQALAIIKAVDPKPSELAAKTTEPAQNHVGAATVQPAVASPTTPLPASPPPPVAASSTPAVSA